MTAKTANRLTKRTRGRAWQSIRTELLQEEPLCRLCAQGKCKHGSKRQVKKRGSITVMCVRAAAEVDHIRPLALGGDDSRSNLQPLCRDCHKHKTASDFARPRTPIGEDGYPI